MTTVTEATTTADTLAPIETKELSEVPQEPKEKPQEPKLVNVANQLFPVDALLTAYQEQFDELIKRIKTKIDEGICFERVLERVTNDTNFKLNVTRSIVQELRANRGFREEIADKLIGTDHIQKVVLEKVKSEADLIKKELKKQIKEQAAKSEDKTVCIAAAPATTLVTPTGLSKKAEETIERTIGLYPETNDIFDTAKGFLKPEDLARLLGDSGDTYALLSPKEREVLWFIEDNIPRNTETVNKRPGLYKPEVGCWSKEGYLDFENRPDGRKLLVNISPKTELVPLHECVLGVVTIELITSLTRDEAASERLLNLNIQYHPKRRTACLTHLKERDPESGRVTKQPYNIYPFWLPADTHSIDVYLKMFDPIDIKRVIDSIPSLSVRELGLTPRMSYPNYVYTLAILNKGYVRGGRELIYPQAG